MNSACLERLPDELLLNVFGRLSVFELPSVMTTCHRFRDLVLDETVWRHHFVSLARVDVNPQPDLSWRQLVQRLLAPSFDVSGRYVAQFGTYGTGAGQFQCPYAIAVLRNGWLAVTDSEGNCVHVVRRDGSLVRRLDAMGVPKGSFNGPGGVAVGPDGRLLVCDGWNRRVQVFDADGRFSRSFPTADVWWGISYDHWRDRLMVAIKDVGVGVFRPDGRPLAVYAAATPGGLPFVHPLDVVADRHGRIFVVDFGAHRCVALAPDGTFAREVGYGLGDKPGFFFRPAGAALSPSGRLLAISDYNGVQLFSTDTGKFVRRVGCGRGRHDGQFNETRKLSFLPDGRLVVADGENHRLQIFE